MRRSYGTGYCSWTKFWPDTMRMSSMTPESIVKLSSALGVLLYAQGDKIKHFGTLPANWIKLTESWLPMRQQVLQYLLNNPSPEHRLALAKASIRQAKIRAKVFCIHLGKMLEHKPSCGCGPRHQCAIYGECVLTGATDKWNVCSRCPDYSPLELA